MWYLENTHFFFVFYTVEILVLPYYQATLILSDPISFQESRNKIRIFFKNNLKDAVTFSDDTKFH